MIVRKYLSVRKILRFTWWKILILAAAGTGTAYLFVSCEQKWIALPMAPVAVLGTALAILLGFRNNSAYERWWEARRLWGAVVNDSRSLARQIVTYVRGNSETETKLLHRELVYRIIAFSAAMRQQLRKLPVLESLRPFLSAEELARYEREQNVANALLQTQLLQLRELKDKGKFTEFELLQMDTRVNTLCDSLGGCERIKNTVFPRQYGYYTSLFTWIFVCLLPLALVAELGYLVIPATVLIGFIFFVLETVGRYIENPFENTINDTPMSAISRTIEINLRQQLGEQELPEPVQAVDGFLF